jgi:uncharacterized protein (DUF1501 family)
MKRRTFIKAIGLSLIASEVLFTKKLNAATNSDNIVIHLFCSGGADFRYLFAPPSTQTEYRDLYFGKQPNICIESDYSPITISNKNVEIRDDAVGLKNLITSNEVAIIPNVWFSDNRDHNHSILRNLIGDNDTVKVTDYNKDAFLGKLAGFQGTNPITVTNRYPFAINCKEFIDSEGLNFSKSRPYGIQSSDTNVDRALKRFYNIDKNNPIVQHFIEMQRTVKSFSDQVNERLSSISGTDLTSLIGREGYFNYQLQSLFDAIDTRDITNSNTFFMNYNGWDFHVNFKEIADYRFVNLYGENGVLELMKNELQKRGIWNNTTIIISAEFGRQLRENGSKGKDHGHGNLLFVLGGNINGGLYGNMFPDSEIEKWESTYGYDIAGETIGYAIYKKIAKNIDENMADIIFPSIDSENIEENFDLYK